MLSAARLRWARCRAWLWRFHTLAYADRLFAGVPGPALLERPLFGHRLQVDVARANPQRLLYLEGERFVAERGLVRSLLRPGMRIADVGANIGYYLLLFANGVGPGGTIHCFEPEPDNLAELRRNVAANGLTNVQVHPVAVGSADGAVALRPGLNGAVAETGGPGTLEVPLRRLDSVLTGGVDLLKIDVEGYEGHVLAGARELLRSHRPALFVEVHPGFLAPPFTVDQVLGLMELPGRSLELYEIALQRGLTGKLAARYGSGVQRIEAPEPFLEDCRAGRREEPFWAVSRP